MANYYGTVRSNYFQVTDEGNFKALIQSCQADSEIFVYEKDADDGVKKWAFGCMNRIDGIPDETGDLSDGMERFAEALQQVVIPGDAIIITEIGNEKLRYLLGVSTVITQEEIGYVDLRDQAIELAKQQLGNNFFVTEMDY